MEKFEPIAIVGVALRLPGGIRSPEALWKTLIDKKSTRGLVPSDRYNIEAFYSPSRKVGSIGMQHGHFLSENLEHIDTSFFAMSQAEVGKVDPQQRMLLEVVWECMESGGQIGWKGTDIGVFAGCWGEDWIDLASKDTQRAGVYDITGSGDFALSNRVSYEYDLHGPSMTVKTACSSSTTALHEACQAIQTGNCASAIVAGTNLILTPTMTTTQTESGVLSPTGECRTFDATANGYARGEAINAIFIKKLSAAIKDGDPVRAVIRATGTNCDGKSAGITTPNPRAHERLIRGVYARAQLDFSDTPFVECHGTGTAAGDPLELEAIANVFGGEKETYIGSVKPNVGHSEGASGITSIIKAILALENQNIPPQVNYSIPNPKIPFAVANLKVPLEVTPWPKDRRERISVNSFGVTGANAHVILDSARSHNISNDKRTQTNGSPSRSPRLILYSASNSESLQKGAEALQKYAQDNISNLEDLAFTLANRREHLERMAYGITDGSEPAQILATGKATKTPQIRFVFTGQGAQWPRMGMSLAEEFPSFNADIRQYGDILDQLPNPPTWSVYDELKKLGHESSLSKAEYAQPLCTIVQIALVNLLRRFGISPSAVVGHSSGEIAAAYAANALTAKEAVLTAYHRGLITTQCSHNGAMAAVGLGRAEVSLYLERGVVVACENSPTSVTLSGDSDGIDYVIEQLKDENPGIFVRRLKTGGMAYHSHHMNGVGLAYETLLKEHPKRKPTVPFFSTVTGRLVSLEELGPSYWRQNLESPVKFYSAVTAMIDDGGPNQVFVEIGPHSALAGPLRQIFKATVEKTQLSYVPTIVRDEKCLVSFLKTLGNLHLHSVKINFAPLTPNGRTLTDLPTYPWRHDKCYWDESRVSQGWRFRKFPHHEILGSRILDGNDLQPTWRNVLRLKEVPWISHHKVFEDVVFPAAAYISMAVEAVRQLCGMTDFSIRHLDIQTALVLNDDQNTELMTTFRPERLTATLDSDSWYEFSVSSYNGITWTKHCVGNIRSGKDGQTQNDQLQHLEAGPLPRIVSHPYLALKKLGLNYGESFQGLHSVSTFPVENRAYAMLRAPEISESHYALHPATIDNCLQLFAFAASDGLSRKMDRLHIPTYIAHLYLRHPEADVSMEAKAFISTNQDSGGLEGSAAIMEDSHVLFLLQGGKFSPVDNCDVADNADTVAAARLHWEPDIDFADAGKLMIPSSNEPKAIEQIEKFAILCMVEMQQQISNMELSSDHLEKCRRWIDSQIDSAQKGNHPLVQDSQTITSMASEDRSALIATMTEQLQTSELAAAAELISRLLSNCRDIFDGKAEVLEVYMHKNGLTNVYNIMADRLNSTEFMKALGHNNPTLRVLEIGAGTGGTSVVALQGLVSPNGERMYSKYSYTDISSGFFSAAQQRFADYQAIEYKTLDISRDPLEQGFEANSYDLIIASNVIHATPKLSTTLKHVRKLLQPDGRFFLQELLPSAPQFMHLIMGVLPGWWLGEADDRPNEPIVQVSRWKTELQGAGFSGIETIVYDDPRENVHICANIIARPIPAPIHFRAVTLLCPSFIKERKNVDDMRAALEEVGFVVECCSLNDIPRSSQDIISLLDLEAPFLDGISEETFENFKTFLGNVGTAGMLWITRAVQINCEDPRYSQFLGLSRTIRSELSIPLATLEIDVFNTSTFSAVARVFNKFQARDITTQIDPDWEFSLLNNEIYIGRYYRISVNDELASVHHAGEHPLKLEIGQRGLLHSLRWVQAPIPVLGSDEVIVEPRCVGMNFKDILVTMGVVGDEGGGVGLECSGVIQEIGANVKNLRVGDRVMILDSNCFSTRKICPVGRCVKIPDSLSFEGAATMPAVYCTVIYSLIRMARLKSRQTILIHSACGGVGIAAIQICKMIGAKVFATVSSSEKVKYLMSTFGISREDIFHSRDESFLPDLMRRTEGRGADVVLNSLSGDLLHASWRCVAPRGTMIEIGRRDFIGRAQLNMDLFEGNRSFIGVNLASLADLYQELLFETVALYDQGHIQPITPVHLFTAENVEESFRFMQKGQHIGKIVVTMSDSADDKKTVLHTAPTRLPLRVRHDAAYLLAGGLGGLGRAVATYLVECGARYLIFLSRSAGSSESDKSFLAELASQDCNVDVIAGSVANLADVKLAVVRTMATGRHIAGVLQLSMVLRDLPLMKMNHEDWRTAVEPKVNGTFNLHAALLESGQELDFFVMFSSALGSFGAAHQSNYAAGNTYQDAFVQYRHHLGLAASVIDVGVMADIGYVSQNVAVESNMRTTGMWFLTEKDLLDALHLSILTGQPPSSTRGRNYTSRGQLGIGFRSTKALSEQSNRVLWRRDKRMSAYRNIEASTSSTSTGSSEHDELDALMSRIEVDPRLLLTTEVVHLLTKEIGLTIYRFMLQPVEEMVFEKSLSALGVDSLVTIELRNWLRRRLGIEVTTLEILSSSGGTIASLGCIAVERLKSRFCIVTETVLDAATIEK